MSTPTKPDDSLDDYQALQAIYLKWHDGRRPLSGFIREVQAYALSVGLEALPEERTAASKLIHDSKGDLLPTAHEINGFNEAIDEMRRTLTERMEEKA